MITFNTFDTNNKQKIAFGTRIDRSARKVLKETFQGKIPADVKAKLEEFRHDGFNNMHLVAERRPLGSSDQKTIQLTKRISIVINTDKHEGYYLSVKDSKTKQEFLLMQLSILVDHKNLSRKALSTYSYIFKQQDSKKLSAILQHHAELNGGI